MKIFTLILMISFLASCASNRTYKDDENCDKKQREDRMNMFEPRGSWVR